ncbi:MAG: hypothetical protein JWN34_473 [Bryobacterales bacterium]|nr:hypothetical protein [Bryobacterales bacterium]
MNCSLKILPPSTESPDLFQCGTAATAEIRERYEHFCELVSLSERRLSSGDQISACAFAQAAARLAYPASAGIFGSNRLERVLNRIGDSIPSSPEKRQRSGTGLNVLHVLSYAKPIGGDGRYAWRWMQADRQNRHSFVITRQCDLSPNATVPEIFRLSAEQSGGFIKTLRASSSKPIAQARELRELCDGMDFVVLHTYPYDIVPCLALTRGVPAKVIYVHHSDHTFWIGASVTDLMVHLRPQHEGFLRERRGIVAEGGYELPIPLPEPPPALERRRAKRLLGYAEDEIVLLTIATPFKYSATGLVSFLELVEPIVSRYQHVRLLAVGPSPDDPAWRSASLRTEGRIKPVGVRWENEVLYAAADIYLDSVPFASITSLLEAGIHGLPLIGYQLQNEELQLMGAGAAGLQGSMILASSRNTYCLTELIEDAAYRTRLGALTKCQIQNSHCLPNWLERLGDVYAAARDVKSRGVMSGQEPEFQAGVLSVALNSLYPRRDTAKILSECFRDLPLISKLRDLRVLRSHGLNAGVSAALPFRWRYAARRLLSTYRA